MLFLLSACNDSPLQSRANNLSDALPEPLTVAETIHAHSGHNVCEMGGIQLLYGLDHNHDGRVGPYESLGTEYLCNPSHQSEEGPRVVTIGEGIPEADKQRILETLSRS